MKKDQTSPSTIDEYIGLYPKDVQALLQSVRVAIKKAAPDAEEKIGYGIPTFTLNGNLVHFGGFKNHIGFYPGAAGVATFSKQLAKYEGAKGSVQFPINKPMPLALIARITKFRVKQNLEKAKRRAVAKRTSSIKGSR